MKYKHIVSFFCIALPVCVVVRTLQVLYTVDAERGFFEPQYKYLGLAMLFVILGACAVTAILSFTAHRAPTKPPVVSIPLGIVSILMGLSIIFELFTESYSRATRPWQIISANVFGIFAAIFFIVYGSKAFFKFSLPHILYIAPALYWIIKLIVVFTTISSLALISDNVFVLTTYCVTLLFMVCLAKLVNGISDDYNFRKLLASGLVSVILCASWSLPRIIAVLLGKGAVLHNSAAVISTPTALITGIFIAVFTFRHFSYNNLGMKRYHHHRHSTKIMPDDGSASDFYVPSKKPTDNRT